MRKFICILCCCLLLAGLVPTAYAANVTASVCTDPVTLNDMDFNATGNMYPKYPLLVYRDITYFPMTYHLCDFLGVATRWDGKSLYIDRAGSSADGYSTEVTTKKIQGRVTASTVGYPVVINGKTFDSKNAQWPLLNYQDVTYFPLTWALAVDELGWDYHWDAKNGLSISSSGSNGSVNTPNSGDSSGSFTQTDGEVMNALTRGFYPSVSEINPENLTVELWSDWSISGIQEAIRKGMSDYVIAEGYRFAKNNPSEIQISYRFQFPAQTWSGMELEVPFTAVFLGETVTLPSGNPFTVSANTRELTATVRLTGEGNPTVDSAFQAEQAKYKQLEKCTQIGDISVDANTVFDPLKLIDTKINSNLASAGLSKQYYIQSISLGTHKTVLSSSETMTVDFTAVFAATPDASLTINTPISKQAVFKTK